jgi:NAD(P)-dependent dehydrogenase (short-subunit alcohol dehydrogenase family)
MLLRMNCVVLGGTGYFGGSVARALRNAGQQVTIASRTPRADSDSLRFDFQDATSFEALNAFDLVINCADTTAAAPDAAISHVLDRGGTFIETTDDAKSILRLIEVFRGNYTPGRLIIGMGIMPGLSNLAAAALAHGRDKDARVEVAIRLNPLSGAGNGMSALSAQVVANVSKRWENGQLIKDPPVWFSPLIPFRDGAAPALRTGLPEAIMLGYSLGARNTAAYLSTGSALIEGALFGASLLMPQDYLFKPIAVKALGGAFSAVRGGLLRNLRTPFEIVAMVGRTDDFRHNGASLSLWISDGIDAAGAAVGAAAQALQASPLAPGVYLPDEAFTLDDILARIAQIEPALKIKKRVEQQMQRSA